MSPDAGALGCGGHGGEELVECLGELGGLAEQIQALLGRLAGGLPGQPKARPGGELPSENGALCDEGAAPVVFDLGPSGLKPGDGVAHSGAGVGVESWRRDRVSDDLSL